MENRRGAETGLLLSLTALAGHFIPSDSRACFKKDSQAFSAPKDFSGWRHEWTTLEALIWRDRNCNVRQLVTGGLRVTHRLANVKCQSGLAGNGRNRSATAANHSRSWLLGWIAMHFSISSKNVFSQIRKWRSAKKFGAISRTPFLCGERILTLTPTSAITIMARMNMIAVDNVIRCV